MIVTDPSPQEQTDLSELQKRHENYQTKAAEALTKKEKEKNVISQSR